MRVDLDDPQRYNADFERESVQHTPTPPKSEWWWSFFPMVLSLLPDCHHARPHLDRESDFILIINTSELNSTFYNWKPKGEMRIKWNFLLSTTQVQVALAVMNFLLCVLAVYCFNDGTKHGASLFRGAFALGEVELRCSLFGAQRFSWKNLLQDPQYFLLPSTIIWCVSQF